MVGPVAGGWYRATRAGSTVIGSSDGTVSPGSAWPHPSGRKQGAPPSPECAGQEIVVASQAAWAAQQGMAPPHDPPSRMPEGTPARRP